MATLGQLDVLPRELLVLTLSFLKPKEFTGFSLVNHAANALANEKQLWLELCRQSFSEDYLQEQDEEKDENEIGSSNGWKKLYASSSSKILLILICFSSYYTMEDVMSKLRAAGQQLEGTCFHMYTRTTSTNNTDQVSEWIASLKEKMKRFKAVLYYSNGGSHEELHTKLGDLFAEYVERGNSVILAPFANAASDECPAGAWAKKNYHILIPSNQGSSMASLGRIVEPDHPIMKGIKKIECGYKSTSPLNPKARAIAYYASNGEDEGDVVLVAEMDAEVEEEEGQVRKTGKIITVNVFPNSRHTDDGAWTPAPDMDVPRLFVNACRYALAQAMYRYIPG